MKILIKVGCLSVTEVYRIQHHKDKIDCAKADIGRPLIKLDQEPIWKSLTNVDVTIKDCEFSYKQIKKQKDEWTENTAITKLDAIKKQVDLS